MIDFKLNETRRVENKELNTVDFVVDYQGKTVVFFRTHACEKGRIIAQLGTGSAESALKAAKKVEADVAGIDINMGCPKKFSMQGGMGAALLENQDTACEIVRTLSTNMSIPVTAKIRIINTVEETYAFIRKLEEAGVSAVTVHLRTKGDTEQTDARTHETLKRIIDMGVKVPVLANGDMYSDARMESMIQGSGCAGVMLARPFLFDPSLVRPEGRLAQAVIMKEFVRKCMQFDIVHQVIKYTLMEMMVLRRHPPSVLRELSAAADKSRFHTSDPIWTTVTRAKSTKDVCVAFEMLDEYTAVYGEGPAASMKPAKRGGNLNHSYSQLGPTGSKKKKKRLETDTLAHPSTFSDSYFTTAAADTSIPKKQKQKQEEEEEEEEEVVVVAACADKPYDIIVAKPSMVHAQAIVDVTNDAYVADQFFKLPQYWDRFSLSDVQTMQKDVHSVFLLVRYTGGKDGDGGGEAAAAASGGGAFVGSLYITLTTEEEQGGDVVRVEGGFGAVAVSTKYSKNGIGKSLILAAEAYTFRHLENLTGAGKGKKKATATMKMGVINLREDLFAWYGRMGYVRGGEIRPNNEELTRICLPELDVCCVMMSKELKEG
jgi:tRNA-dihydrouridine synthase 2